jgi:methylenetetrahydrofolate reductase (NADPH)
MTVLEHLARATTPFVSVEIIPPRRGGSVAQIHKAVESILPYKPPYMDVTSHSAEVIMEEMPDGSYKRRVKRKAPGTFGLCAAIKYKFNIDPVPHLLCTGFTREETEDALIELNYLGVENVLLIRGDNKIQKPIPDGRSANKNAIDLVEQVSGMNRGHYLDALIDAQPAQFCIGVGAYPEKHFESPNLAFDIDILKRKQAAGAHYAVTQLFYDNAHFYAFRDAARAAGVTIPIIPGLKILNRKAQLTSIPKAFFVDLPEELTKDLMAAKDDQQAEQIGIAWATKQAMDLLEHGEKNLHFYIMQNTDPFRTMMANLSKHI